MSGVVQVTTASPPDTSGLHGVAASLVAKDASLWGPQDAVYDTVIETPALHFLVAPGGKWFQRASVLLFFYAPIVGELRNERVQRGPSRPAPKKPEPAPATAGDLVLPPDGAQ